MRLGIGIAGLLVCLSLTASADTFRHQETGEVFHGFRTQRRSAGKILVFNSDENKMTAIEEGQYEITLDSKGRRDRVVRIAIRQPEVMISKVVAERIAQSIVELSNTGPQYIVLDIDSPGGRGEYMRIIASAVEQATNVPIVAYISGGDYGGAYSAAAVVALACDAVYIAPTAAIGAIGPMPGAVSAEQYTAYLSLYSPDTLVAYSSYAVGLMQKPRLRIFARALLDRSVSVQEVVDTDGTTHYVQREDRRPAQTVVRTLAEGVSSADYRALGDDTPSMDLLGRALMLTAEDAVRIGLADDIVSSIAQISIARGVSEAQLINAPDIDATVRRFSAARRNLGQTLLAVDQLEYYAETLENQVAKVEEQLRTGTVQHEVSRRTLPSSSRQRRGRVVMPSAYENYYDPSLTSTTRDAMGRPTTRSDRRRNREVETERFIADQPLVSFENLRAEQVVVLRNLVNQYNIAIRQARRWPGALPPDLPVQTLEANMNSASALLDYILRYPMQPAQQSQTGRAPIR